MRSTLDATREFDAFLVSLVHEAPPEAIALRQVRGRERDAPMKGDAVWWNQVVVGQRRHGSRRQSCCGRCLCSVLFFRRLACFRTLRVCRTAGTPHAEL